MRQEFSKRVRADAFERAAGKCERCGGWLMGKQRYNHRIPDAMGGLPSLANCEVLCRGCDHTQTYKIDIPAIAKTTRLRIRAAGIRKPRTITTWRKFSGEIVRAQRERS